MTKVVLPGYEIVYLFFKIKYISDWNNNDMH